MRLHLYLPYYVISCHLAVIQTINKVTLTSILTNTPVRAELAAAQLNKKKKISSAGGARKKIENMLSKNGSSKKSRKDKSTKSDKK